MIAAAAKVALFLPGDGSPWLWHLNSERPFIKVTRRHRRRRRPPSLPLSSQPACWAWRAGPASQCAPKRSTWSSRRGNNSSKNRKLSGRRRGLLQRGLKDTEPAGRQRRSPSNRLPLLRHLLPGVEHPGWGKPKGPTLQGEGDYPSKGQPGSVPLRSGLSEPGANQQELMALSPTSRGYLHGNKAQRHCCCRGRGL